MTKEELKVLKNLRRDLLLRSDIDSRGMTVVNVSSSIWIAFNELLEENTNNNYI